MPKNVKNKWNVLSNSEKNARMESVLLPQAMFLRVQVRTPFIGMVQTVDHSSTLKCRTPTDKIQQPQVCSVHRACRSWEVIKVPVAATFHSTRPHCSNNTVQTAIITNQIKISIMVKVLAS